MVYYYRTATTEAILSEATNSNSDNDNDNVTATNSNSSVIDTILIISLSLVFVVALTVILVAVVAYCHRRQNKLISLMMANNPADYKVCEEEKLLS